MTAVPTRSAVTRPFRSTLAMSGCEEAHVKVCPGTGLPLASWAMAVNCCVPRMASVAVGGLTTTAVTTRATVRVALPADRDAGHPGHAAGHSHRSEEHTSE